LIPENVTLSSKIWKKFFKLLLTKNGNGLILFFTFFKTALNLIFLNRLDDFKFIF